MITYSYKQVQNYTDWLDFKSQCNEMQIAYECSEDEQNKDDILIDGSKREVSSFAAGPVFRVLGIGLTDYSTAARIYRAALGVFLVIATLGFSLCFQGFRDLFTKQIIGTIVIKPYKSSRDLLDEDNEEVSHLYIEAGFTDSNGRKKYIAAIDLNKNGITEPSDILELDDVEIRDLMSALPAEKFEAEVGR